MENIYRLRAPIFIIAILSLFILRADDRLMGGGDDDDYFAVATSLSYLQFPSYDNEFHSGEKGPYRSVGTGVLAAPFVAAFSIFDRIDDAPIVTARTKDNRYWTWSLFGFHIAVYTFLIIGIWFLYSHLRLWVSDFAATIVTSVSVFAGGGLLIYAFQRPTMTHVFEFFTVSTAAFVTSKRLANKHWNLAPEFVGALAALIFLVRYNNLLLAFSFMTVIFLLDQQQRIPNVFFRLMRSSIIFVAGIFIFRILPVIWNGYSEHDNAYDGSLDRLYLRMDPLFYLNRFYDFVLSPEMGLIFTGPAILLGCAALCFSWSKLSRYHLLLISTVTVNLYIAISWGAAGSYYGWRYICFTAMPLLALPLAIATEDLAAKFQFSQRLVVVLAFIICVVPIASVLSFYRAPEYYLELVTTPYGYETWGQPDYHTSLIYELVTNPVRIFGRALFDGIGSFFTATNLTPINFVQRGLLYLLVPSVSLLLGYKFYFLKITKKE